MSSPKLDENHMMAALRAPVTLETLRLLQTGAFMLILDAYDRKATRENMITAVSAATTLLTQLGKFYMVEQINEVRDIVDGVSPVQIEEARHGVRKLLGDAVRDAIAMAQLLQQCSEDEDRVH